MVKDGYSNFSDFSTWRWFDDLTLGDAIYVYITDDSVLHYDIYKAINYLFVIGLKDKNPKVRVFEVRVFVLGRKLGLQKFDDLTLGDAIYVYI